MAPSSGKVYAGAAAPESMLFRIESTSSGLDVGGVTSITMDVARPDGTEVEWSWDSSSFKKHGPTYFEVERVFALDASDVPIPGTYHIRARIVSAAGTRRLAPTTFIVEKY